MCIHVHNVGTHDIQNISVSSPLPGQVRVTGDFIEGSIETGIFIVIYKEEDFHFVYHSALRSVENKAVSTTVNLPDGNYKLFVFGFEGNGTYLMATIRPTSVSLAFSSG